MDNSVDVAEGAEAGSLSAWLEEDRLREECGVFGVLGHPDAVLARTRLQGFGISRGDHLGGRRRGAPPQADQP